MDARLDRATAVPGHKAVWALPIALVLALGGLLALWATGAFAADAASVTGTVTSAQTGEPLAGVEVQVTVGEGAWTIAEGVTDVDGNYSISGIDLDEYLDDEYLGSGDSLEVMIVYLDRVHAHLQSGPRYASLTPGGAAVVDVVLVPGSAFTGTVTAADTDLPLEGVCVYVSPATGSGSTDNVCTDAAGRYQTRGLPAAGYKVQFNPPGGVPYRSQWFGGASTSSASTTVTTTTGTITPNIGAALVRGGVIAGVVTAEDTGLPLDSCVSVVDVATSAYAAWVCADDGVYSTPGLAPGSYRVLFISNDSRYLNEYWDDAPVFGEESTITIVGTETFTADAALTLGGSISGTVTGQDGPVEGAYVSVRTPAGMGLGTYTDLSGRYHVGGLRSGDHTVGFQAPSSGPGSNLLDEYYDDVATQEQATPVAVVVGQATSGIDAELAVGGSIEGVVTGPDGPVSDVQVVVYQGSSWWAINGAVTDASGAYTVGGLPTGTYQVQFHPTPSSSAGSDLLGEWYDDKPTFDEATPVSVTVGAVTPGVDAELAVGGSISGTVTGPDGPVAGAPVSVSGPGYGSAHTDGDGNYHVVGLAAGSYTVYFGSPYLGDDTDLMPEYYDDATNWEDATPVTVALGAETSGIDAALIRGGSISGTVTGPDGAVVGASVSAYEYLPGDLYGYWRGSATTDSLGRYRITGLSTGTFRVKFTPPSSGPGSDLLEEYNGGTQWQYDAPLIDVSTGVETPGIDAVLARGGSVTGIVTGPDGPLSNVWVQVSADEGSYSPGYNWSGYTDSTGTYRAVGLRSAAYIIEFSPPSWGEGSDLFGEYFDNAHDWWNATPVAVTAGSETSGIDAELSRGGSISGTVTGLAGPITGVAVTASPLIGSGDRTVYTNESGHYVLNGLVPGGYTVQFVPLSDGPGSGLAPEYYEDAGVREDATSIVVDIGDHVAGVDAELEVGGSISGTVSGPDGPVPGASVWVGLSDWSFSKTVQTGADGGYQVDGLPSGSYLVRFSPPACWDPAEDCPGAELAAEYYDDALTEAAATLVGVLKGSATDGVDAELALPEPAISGIVRDKAGDPVGDVEISIYSSSSGFWVLESMTTDATGHYQFDVGPGSYKLKVRDLQGRFVSDWLGGDWWNSPTLTYSGDSPVHFDPVLNDGTAISGVVLDEITGEPVAGIYVQVRASWDFEYTNTSLTVTDDEGRFMSHGLAPGSYYIDVPLYLENGLSPRYLPTTFEPPGGTPTPWGTPVEVVDTTPVDDVVIDLRVGGSIRGRVIDSESGEPVDAGWVYVKYRSGADARSSVARSEISTEGTFQTTAIEPGTDYVLEIVADGFDPQWVDGVFRVADIAEAQGFDAIVDQVSDVGDVSVYPGARTELTGTIVDVSTDEPLVNHWVRLRNVTTNAVVSVPTDGTGRFSARVVPGSTYFIQSDDFSYWYPSTSLGLIEVLDEQSLELGTFGLVKGARISGEVTDALTGLRVNGFVATSELGGGSFVGSTYSLGPFQPGPHTIGVSASGYVDQYYDEAINRDDATPIVLSSGESLTIDFALVPGATVTGTITDESGSPLSACIDVVDAGDRKLLATSCTNAQGRYAVDGIRPGDALVRFRPSLDEFAPEYWEDARLAARAVSLSLEAGQQVDDLDAVLAVMGPEIYGHVRDAGTWDEVEDVCAYLYEADGVTSTGQAYCTGNDGDFLFLGLEPGDYVVAVSDPEGRYISDHQTVSVGAGQTRVTFDLGEVDHADLRGRAVVWDESAGSYVPVEGACAYVYDENGQSLAIPYCSGSDGRFGFLDLVTPTGGRAVDVVVVDPLGRYATLRTSSDIYPWSTVEADYVLDAGSISGAVTDVATGLPVEGVCAYLHAAASDDYTGRAYCTGADGRYAFVGLEDTVYRVWISDPEARYLTFASGEVDPATGVFDVALAPGASLAGRITDSATGEGIGTACLYLYGVDDSPAGYATCTRDDGYYALAGVPTGEYKVGVADTSGAHRTVWSGGGTDVYDAGTISIVDGQVTAHDAAMVGIGIVTGTVLDSNGQPVADTAVYLGNLDGTYSGLYGVTDATGQFTILGVPAGEYKAGFYPPGMGTPSTLWSGGGTSEETAGTFSVSVGATTYGVDATVAL